MQCYAVDSATKNRQNVGYVMLDLRTAHPKSQQVCSYLLREAYAWVDIMLLCTFPCLLIFILPILSSRNPAGMGC